MHSSSYNEMLGIIKEFYSQANVLGKTVVDVGSQDVNGSYKKIFNGWDYVGIDSIPGNNVDELMVEEFKTPFPHGYADLVVSGQCLEHCRNPFKLVNEMYRICKSGGMCVLIAPFIWKEHKYPIDCWRFLPDGINALFDNAGFKCIRSYIKGTDCIGVGGK